MALKNDLENIHGKIFSSWEVANFDKYERGTAWYVIAGLIGAALLAYSVWTMNFLFAVIVLMFAILIVLHDLRAPRFIDCAITESGVLLGEKLYKWSEFENFWILYKPPELKNLYFELKGVRPRLAIPLDSQDPNKLRETLGKYLLEDTGRDDEPITEYVGRILKI